MVDLEYGLSISVKLAAKGMELFNHWIELMNTHDHSNWNMLRIPFVCSVAHGDVPELQFDYYEWEDLADQRDDYREPIAPSDNYLVPDYRVFLEYSIDRREQYHQRFYQMSSAERLSRED